MNGLRAQRRGRRYAQSVRLRTGIVRDWKSRGRHLDSEAKISKRVKDRRAQVDAIVSETATAREQDYLLTYEIYCDGVSDGCPAREITIQIKDHDRTLVKLIKRQGGFRCPLCGGFAKMHWVRTATAERADNERLARCSVNMQMLRRQRAHPGDIFFMSASEVLDDRLPPTPDGWFKPSSLDGNRGKKRRFVKNGEE